MASIGPSIPAHLQNRQQQRHESDEDKDGSDIGPSLPSSIGPSIPPHLLKRSTTPDDDDDDAVGPALPPDLKRAAPSRTEPAPAHAPVDEAEDSDSDDYLPALPPDLLANRQQGPSRPSPPPAKRVLGPSFPTGPPPPPRRRHASDDEEEYGPMPPVGPQVEEERDGVQEFIEREKRRAENIADASKPKKLVREEWMLVPPTASSLLGNIDTTKLKARQFSRATEAPASTRGMELWTETPEERLKRIQEEVTGKRKRVADVNKEEDGEEERKRRRRDEEIERKVQEHNERAARNASLLHIHGSKLAKTKDGKADKDKEIIWDHDRDMSLGGRLMDDGKRADIIKDAKGLGGRFSRGKSGGFL